MSALDGREGIAGGAMSRRELVSALARWTVPTVLTLSLGVRAAYAAASCPPCTKKLAGVCRACTVSAILQCQCEPCLGAPYCPGGARAAAFQPAPSASVTQGGGSGPTPEGQQALETILRRRAQARSNDPLLPGFGRSRADSSFFGPSRSPYGRLPFGSDPRRTTTPRGLYERLRANDARRPF